MSASLSRKTSTSTGKALLARFSRDIGDTLDQPNFGWYPQQYNFKGAKGILSKVASGSFYFVELDSRKGKKPVVTRLWDLDHAKTWDDAWHNRAEQ